MPVVHSLKWAITVAGSTPRNFTISIITIAVATEKAHDSP